MVDQLPGLRQITLGCWRPNSMVTGMSLTTPLVQGSTECTSHYTGPPHITHVLSGKEDWRDDKVLSIFRQGLWCLYSGPGQRIEMPVSLSGGD